MLPSVVEKALRVAGPTLFLSIQGSSLQTALKIRDDQSIGKLSPIPFVSLFTNCVLWTMYGYRIKDLTVFVPNFVGVFTGLLCSSIFHFFAPVKPLVLYTLAALIIGTGYMSNTVVLGSIGSALAVATSGSPLAVIRTVIRDETTDAMPFKTSFFFFLNAISWLCYGLFVSNDIMVYGPNALGLVLASVQMAMYIKYGMPGKKKLLL